MMAHRACDGLSCRVVTEFRESILAKMLVTVRRVYDSLCCSSIVKFRELIPRTQISKFKCFRTRHSTDRRSYDGLSYLSSRVIKRATGELYKCGTTESMTVHHDHDGPSRDPSTQSVFITNDSTTRND